MALLDRLLPAWRHSDPEIRAAAVRELGEDSLDVLTSIARGDTDARVRRVALKKLVDADVLLEIARTDVDEDLRQMAAARAEELLLDRAVSGGEPEGCLRALDALGRPAHRATVATRAAHPSVRRAALGLLTDERLLAEVARRGDNAEIGLAALERVTDVTLLQRLAAGAPSDVALAALGRVQDPAALQAIAEDHHAHKSVRKRARAMLDAILPEDHPIRAAARHERQTQLCAVVEALSDVSDPVAVLVALRDAEGEWRDVCARTAAEPTVEERFQHACAAVRAAIARAEEHQAAEQRREIAHEQRLAAQQRICETVEGLQGAETPKGLEAAEAAWVALGSFDDPHGRDLSARFAAALQRCRERYERWRVRHEFHSQLEALVKDAEQLVASGDPRAAARPRAGLEKRWEQLVASPSGIKWFGDERALQQRFTEAGEALQQQEQSRRTEREEREREARNRLNALTHRLEQLAEAATITSAAAERALVAAADAEEHLRALPTAEREPSRQRLKAARQALVQRAQENADVEDWKHWVNRDAQQRLIERAEGLLAAGDPRQMLRELGRLDQEWKRFASAPRDEARALWDRFRRARGELRRLGAAYLTENLAKKEALCAAAEKLADSTEWNATATAIRQMQEEWKQIGPVRQQLSAALFERFRAPANKFFERHKQFRDARKEQREETLGRMRSLCEAAEALADSTDWDATDVELKRLQAEARDVWQQVRRPLRSKPETPRQTDLLRDRFKAACDRFYDRYRRRAELARDAKLAAADAIVVDLESLAAALAGAEAPPAEEVAPRLQERLAEWSRASVPPAHAAALTQRLQTACDAIEAACPAEAVQQVLDVDSIIQQREKICSRLERLATSIAETAEPAANELAERLKLALAARTIGGKALTEREQARREALDTAEKLRQKWQRLGPIVGRRTRALAERFAKASAAL